MRKRMVGAFEHFVDGRNKSDDEIARYLREKEIDIAVCLIGFVDGRQGIFASRIAPVQVNLGYGGTMGASFIDYIVADRHVIPEACEVFYREKVVRLPEPSMGYYEPPEPEPTPPPRASLGLPSAGFVFCCFNAHYKIQPDVFDVWMKLLRDVEGSVLWLREGPAEVTTNLRREAERRGIKADRLVFAPPLKRLKDHLARHRAADLFVDNVPYSAHTTACDALWAGLPLVTCSGETFVSRVAGGLLKSVGLPELVAGNLADYEAVIRRLVAKPALLLDIKAKLARQRRGGALFNPERFCRYLENAFVTMHDRQRRGLPPESFDVPAAAPKSFLSRLLRSK
jgi:predicted O-linked N-acetylglucosamine transferase (SPINDLY family)